MSPCRTRQKHNPGLEPEPDSSGWAQEPETALDVELRGCHCTDKIIGRPKASAGKHPLENPPLDPCRVELRCVRRDANQPDFPAGGLDKPVCRLVPVVGCAVWGHDNLAAFLAQPKNFTNVSEFVCPTAFTWILCVLMRSCAASALAWSTKSRGDARSSIASWHDVPACLPPPDHLVYHVQTP